MGKGQKAEGGKKNKKAADHKAVVEEHQNQEHNVMKESQGPNTSR